jgi:DNA-binding NarL/FixJ family response regulator
VGDEVFGQAFEQGAAYSFEQAVSLALGKETERGGSATPGRAGGLTRREHEIAELLSEGLSNKEIAARLVIGQRTAETHVEHILGKLGFSSRAQVARWIAEQRAH